MKCKRSAVSTTIAALPVKLVRYRMFGSDVTTSASRDRAAQASRTIWWRRLSASAVACDMDRGTPRFQRGQRPDDLDVLVLVDGSSPAGGRDLDLVQLVDERRDRPQGGGHIRLQPDVAGPLSVL